MLLPVEVPEDYRARACEDWVRCEAFRLVRRNDGSYSLLISFDLSETVKAELDRACR